MVALKKGETIEKRFFLVHCAQFSCRSFFFPLRFAYCLKSPVLFWREMLFIHRLNTEMEKRSSKARIVLCIFSPTYIYYFTWRKLSIAPIFHAILCERTVEHTFPWIFSSWNAKLRVIVIVSLKSFYARYIAFYYARRIKLPSPRNRKKNHWVVDCITIKSFPTIHKIDVHIFFWGNGCENRKELFSHFGWVGKITVSRAEIDKWHDYTRRNLPCAAMTEVSIKWCEMTCKLFLSSS